MKQMTERILFKTDDNKHEAIIFCIFSAGKDVKSHAADNESPGAKAAAAAEDGVLFGRALDEICDGAEIPQLIKVSSSLLVFKKYVLCNISISMQYTKQ